VVLDSDCKDNDKETNLTQIRNKISAFTSKQAVFSLFLPPIKPPKVQPNRIEMNTAHWAQ
jgi:hypothetical protein